MAKVVNCGTLPDPPRDSPYLTAKELAHKYSVTAKTIYRWVQLGKVSAVRVGRTIRFDDRHLIAPVERRNDPTYS